MGVSFHLVFSFFKAFLNLKSRVGEPEQVSSSHMLLPFPDGYSGWQKPERLTSIEVPHGCRGPSASTIFAAVLAALAGSRIGNVIALIQEASSTGDYLTMCSTIWPLVCNLNTKKTY